MHAPVHARGHHRRSVRPANADGAGVAELVGYKTIFIGNKVYKCWRRIGARHALVFHAVLQGVWDAIKGPAQMAGCAPGVRCGCFIKDIGIQYRYSVQTWSSEIVSGDPMQMFGDQFNAGDGA